MRQHRQIVHSDFDGSNRTEEWSRLMIQYSYQISPTEWGGLMNKIFADRYMFIDVKFLLRESA